MNYKWEFVVITETDTRSLIQPVLSESTRVAVFVLREEKAEPLGADGGHTGNRHLATSWLSSIYAFNVDLSGKIGFEEINPGFWTPK